MYLIVLSFITIGSVLRNVNLLILMAGMMYAPLLINWRLAVRRLRSFKARRSLPNRIHAGKLVSVQWHCENQLAGIPAYNVVVDDKITRAEDQTAKIGASDRVGEGQANTLRERWFGELISRVIRRNDDANVSRARVRFQRLNAHKTETQSYRAFFGQRGKYFVSDASVSTSFPFGLIVSRNFIDQTETFFVAPELGALEPTWERRVQSTAVGSDSVKRSRALEEDEFYALRPWRSGDSKKSIHWRTTARQGFPVVKQFDQQNNRDFAIALDLHVAPDDPLGQGQVETALSFAATAVMQVGNEVQGQISVAICGDELHHCRSRTPQGVVSEAMQTLATVQGIEYPRIVDGIIDSLDSVSGGTPIYVVSTRPKPASLELMLPTSTESSKTGTSDRQARQLARRLRQALPMVRWLFVDSEEFKSIFSLDSAANPARSSTLEELRSVSEKWVENAKR